MDKTRATISPYKPTKEKEKIPLEEIIHLQMQCDYIYE